MFRLTTIVLFAASFLTGCAAALVPYSSNPKQKIADAYWLFDEKYRALPAERLLHEAITIYQKKNDNAGLAEAYKAYAVFLRSYSVERYSKRYIERGFIEPSVTYKNRFIKSIEFLDKSEKYYASQNQFGKLTNNYLHKGYTYSAGGMDKEACSSFKKSLDANHAMMKQKPDAKLALAGFKTYDDFIDDLNKRAKCPSLN